MEGRIKHANSRGFGFIETRDLIEFYFHHTSFDGNWKHLLKRFVNEPTVMVEFESDPDGPEGPKAKCVKFKSS